MTDDEKSKLSQELAHVIHQIRRVGWHPEIDQKVRRSEFRVLVILLHTDASGMKMSDISRQMQITPGAVTHMINSLEEGAYIERLADPADRRVVRVKLTDKGKHTIEILKIQFLDTLTGLIDFIGEQDSRELLRLLSETLTYFSHRQEGT